MIPISVKVDGGQKAESDLRSLERGLDSLSGGVGSISSGLRGMSAGAGAAVAGITAIAAAATAAAATAVRLGVALRDLGMRGGEVSAVAVAFERIASPSLLSRMREATGGLVDEMELMRGTTQALRSGMATESEITEWFGAVTRSAQDMGRDVPQAIQAITQVLSGGGLESLSRIGVNALAIRDSLQAMGLSADSARGRTLALRMAMGQLRQDLGSVDNSAGNLNDAWTQLSVAARSWYDNVARAFAENRALVDFFVELRAVLEQTGPSASEAAAALVDLTEVMVELTQSTISGLRAYVGFRAAVEEFNPRGAATAIGALYDNVDILINGTNESDGSWRRLSETLDDANGTLSSISSPLERLRERLAAGATAADSQAQSIDRLAESYRNLDDASQWGSGERDLLGDVLGMSIDPNLDDPNARGRARVRASIAAGHPSNKQTGGGGGGGTEPKAESMTTWQEEQQRLQELKISLDTAYWQAQDEANQREIDQARIALRQTFERIDAENEQFEQRRRDQEQTQRAQEEEAQRWQEMKAEQEETAEALAQRTSAAIGSAASAAGIFQSIGQIIAANEKDIEKRKKKEGKFVIAYSSVMAAVELAKSIAAFADWDYVGGAAHLASMAAFISAAAQAGSELGGGSEVVPVATSTKPAGRPDAPNRETGDRVQVVNLFAVERPTGPLGQQLERASYERERQGYREQRPAGIGYE